MRAGGSRIEAGQSKLGDRLILLGYTFADVRRETGICRWDMNDYTHHRRRLTPGHLSRLCRFLHCEPEVIYE